MGWDPGKIVASVLSFKMTTLNADGNCHIKKYKQKKWPIKSSRQNAEYIKSEKDSKCSNLHQKNICRGVIHWKRVHATRQNEIQQPDLKNSVSFIQRNWCSYKGRLPASLKQPSGDCNSGKILIEYAEERYQNRLCRSFKHIKMDNVALDFFLQKWKGWQNMCNFPM